MIDLSTEQTIPLGEVPSVIPRARSGKKVNLASVYRWVRPGVNGVTLEAVKLGGRYLTSREAIQRFSDALTAKANGSTGAASPTARRRTARQRKAGHKAATRKLAKAGI